jgi:mannitol/fructose-specific phosphotransferase system IIA component (Ntr-type)
MKLLGFLSQDAVVLDMKSAAKEDAIKELIQVLVDQGEVSADDHEAILKAVLDREAIGSTGLGDGIAIPHVKDCPHVEGLTGAFGRSAEGITFDAIDGKPVTLMFLILGGPGTSDEHIQTLRKLATLRMNNHFLRFLRNAEGHKAVIETIQEMAGSVA